MGDLSRQPTEKMTRERLIVVRLALRELRNLASRVALGFPFG